MTLGAEHPARCLPHGDEGTAMNAERAAAEDSRTCERVRSEGLKNLNGYLWKVLEGGLRVATLYFAYKGNEAATAVVAGLEQLVQVFRR